MSVCLLETCSKIPKNNNNNGFCTKKCKKKEETNKKQEAKIKQQKEYNNKKKEFELNLDKIITLLQKNGFEDKINNSNYKCKLLDIDNWKIIIRYCFGDNSFLPSYYKIFKTKKEEYKKLKEKEDNFFGKKLKEKHPKLKFKKQWTTKFGEFLVEDILNIIGFECNSKVETKEHLKPDLETFKDILGNIKNKNGNIIEIKTQTYYTEGTAGERMLGTPFKYSGVPLLYGKNLYIICIANAEKLAKEKYELFDDYDCCTEIKKKILKRKKEILNFYKELGIEYICFTDLLKKLY